MGQQQLYWQSRFITAMLCLTRSPLQHFLFQHMNSAACRPWSSSYYCLPWLQLMCTPASLPPQHPRAASWLRPLAALPLTARPHPSSSMGTRPGGLDPRNPHTLPPPDLHMLHKCQAWKSHLSRQAWHPSPYTLSCPVRLVTDNWVRIHRHGAHSHPNGLSLPPQNPRSFF